MAMVQKIAAWPWWMQLLAVVLIGGLGAAFVFWWAGSMLSAPHRRVAGAPPPALGAAPVEILARTGPMRGWYAPGRPGAGAVLLLHGVRADRSAMLPRALALHQQGFAVLLVDLPAHGESAGEQITFGAQEGAAVRDVLAWLRRQLPAEKLGVIGASLGGAALLLSGVEPAPDAVVLEAVFPSIDAAVDNRVRARVGALSALVSPVLLWQLPLRIGVDPEQLRPISRIAALRAPVLVAGGTTDVLTTQAETEQLFAAARAPKQLWLVPGAAHVDLYAFAPEAYQAQVFGFLQHYLQKQ